MRSSHTGAHRALKQVRKLVWELLNKGRLSVDEFENYARASLFRVELVSFCICLKIVPN